jgi:hypothetical protein
LAFHEERPTTKRRSATESSSAPEVTFNRGASRPVLNDYANRGRAELANGEDSSDLFEPPGRVLVEQARDQRLIRQPSASARFWIASRTLLDSRMFSRRSLRNVALAYREYRVRWRLPLRRERSVLLDPIAVVEGRDRRCRIAASRLQVVLVGGQPNGKAITTLVFRSGSERCAPSIS